MNGTDVNILCKVKSAIDYCWFSHPDGLRISVSDKMEHKAIDKFRYFGTGLKLGECGVTIVQTNLSDTGAWKCHMGTLVKTGFEVSKEFNVRISGKKKHHYNKLKSNKQFFICL